jgi:hypothetical protein
MSGSTQAPLRAQPQPARPSKPAAAISKPAPVTMSASQASDDDWETF